MLIERAFLAWAGLCGALAVAVEAIARHGLSGDPYRQDLAATGGRYGLIHSLGLLGVAPLSQSGGDLGAGRLWLRLGGGCFALGLLLFCGSLYLLAAGGPAGLSRATPVGGSLFILGWAALVIAAARAGRNRRF